MDKNILKNIPQIVFSEICLKCEGCCRFESPDSEWRARCAAQETAEIGAQFCDAKQYLITKSQTDCRCVFLDDDNHCEIYDHRPFECVLYPFLLVRQGEKLFLGAHTGCPAVAEYRQTEVFRNVVQALKAWFQQTQIRDLIRSNPGLAGTYQSVLGEIDQLFEIAYD